MKKENTKNLSEKKLTKEQIVDKKNAKRPLSSAQQQFGNKHALGSTTNGVEKKYDREAVGKQFVEWARTHPDCLSVPHFSTANGHYTTTLIKWCDETPVFKELYNNAKEIIGLNRLNAMRLDAAGEAATGKKAFDKSVYMKFMTNFDPDFKSYDREEKTFDSSLKKEELKVVMNASDIIEQALSGKYTQK